MAPVSLWCGMRCGEYVHVRVCFDESGIRRCINPHSLCPIICELAYNGFRKWRWLSCKRSLWEVFHVDSLKIHTGSHSAG